MEKLLHQFGWVASEKFWKSTLSLDKPSLACKNVRNTSRKQWISIRSNILTDDLKLFFFRRLTLPSAIIQIPSTKTTFPHKTICHFHQLNWLTNSRFLFMIFFLPFFLIHSQEGKRNCRQMYTHSSGWMNTLKDFTGNWQISFSEEISEKCVRKRE